MPERATASGVDTQPRVAAARLTTSPRSSTIIVILAFAGACLLLHEATNGRYGYFRDELYYLDCAHHLALGYPDFAPLTAWLMRLSETLFGTGLHGLGLLPALSGAGKIILTGLIALQFGADLFGVALACLCVLVAPVYLVLDTQFAANTFEPLFWMGAVSLLIAVIESRRLSLLAWIGLLIGIGFENKPTIVLFAVALIIGLLLTPERRLLLSWWTLIAVVIALLCAAPNLLWQYHHQWPTLQEIANVRQLHLNAQMSAPAFILEQIRMLNAPALLVWIPGLALLLWKRPWRSLGIAYLVLLIMMIAAGAKDYYVSPIYPMLFAAGGAAWTGGLSAARGWGWLKVPLVVLVVAGGIVAAPLALPILSPGNVVRYEGFLGLSNPTNATGQSGPLPEHFGDEFGWPEMVAKVAKVYHSLPLADRNETAILAHNYGEAGAIDFFGPRFGLPQAISAHQSYYLWGPRNYRGKVMIVIQGDRDKLRRECDSVENGPIVDNPYSMKEEHFQLYVCRGLHPPLPQLWPHLKRWY